jgi:hypothetical protein
VEHIRATVLSDLDTYTVRPKRNESSAQALINMLTVRKRDHGDVNWISLFIDYSPEAEGLMALGEEESVKFDCMTMQTCTGDTASLAVTDPKPPSNNSWLKALSNFFEDQWSGVVGMMSRPEAPPKPQPSAHKHGSKKNAWMPHDRRIVMNGKTVLLLALLWCTTQEQLLFAKYPEVCGHDTKAQVCSSNAPWYYCVGYRENFHTYIIMRGLVNNESLAMFMFITHVAWPYLHQKKVIKCIRAHISDGKDEQLRALHSMCMRDGDSPHAKVLRCAWHIVNRAMYRLFGSATRDWQRTFEKVFWIWQQQETHESVKKIYDWITTTFFTNTHVLNDMSPSDLSIVDSFVGGIWATRDQWSVAHNLELEAFDLRVNTFTEAQFSVLTQHVGVSASMSAPTFVRAEDLAHLYRHNKLMLQNFRQGTRSYSHVAQTKSWFTFVEEHFCHKPLQMAKLEVEIASSCIRSRETKFTLCIDDGCTICKKYLTVRQQQLMRHRTLKIHIRCYVNNPEKQVKFASLPYDFQNIVRSVPTEKHWRVVTCHDMQSGFLVLCSCGWSIRNMMCCLHCSIVLQKATNFECCGCEEESVSIRHTHAFAGIQDRTVIERTHDDWKGVFCKMLSAESICAAFPQVACEESESEAAEEPTDHGHDHDTRHIAD